MAIYYKKPNNESLEKYNKIENRKKFSSINLIKIIHIVYLIVIIIHWFIFRANIDFCYSITRFANNNLNEKEKLKMSEKAKLLRKDSFFIKQLFVTISQKENEKYFKSINFIKLAKNIYKHFFAKVRNILIIIAFSLKTIYPLKLSLISLFLAFLSQIWFMIPLLLVFNLFESLRVIFISTLFEGQSSYTLILLIIYILLILYIFSWISFFFFPNMFKYEAVDENNEQTNQNYLEETICSSSVPCFLYFMNVGLSSEGSIEMNLISFKNNTKYYLYQFFFEILLYVFIHMIFFNVVLAMIGNAFDKMNEKLERKRYSEINVCFICEKTRNDCIINHEDFEKHLENHNKWKYIIYISNIILKNKEEYTREEYYVWRQIKHKKLDWFPNYTKMKS